LLDVLDHLSRPHMKRATSNKKPASATHGGVAAFSLIAFLLAVALVRFTLPFGKDIVRSALFVLGVTLCLLFLVDLSIQKVYRRSSTCLDFSRFDPALWRVMNKLLGLAGTLGLFAFIYWAVPEYRGNFYDRYFAMLRAILPIWLALAIPYFYLVDCHMKQPIDGYSQMGMVLTLRWSTIERHMLSQHLLGWLVKGFFMPLMFTYLCNDLGKMIDFNFEQLSSTKTWFDFLYDLFFFVDVGFAAMGYLISLRLTDTHLRSTELTMLGWLVALVCYEPFWSLLGRQYLAYDTGYQWGGWLWKYPVLYNIWAASILTLTATYAWATVSFGARFSNLTHRGIITNGPYRWTKHPAYITKNLSYWMISIPFLAQGGNTEALRHCLLLFGLNSLYVLRAKTEERHLSLDPVYVRYAEWIASHGIFRCLRLFAKKT
jgi:hypothetical protein